MKGASWHKARMAIHFGINPVNGGIPLNDRSITGMASWNRGDLELILLNWVTFFCSLT